MIRGIPFFFELIIRGIPHHLELPVFLRKKRTFRASCEQVSFNSVRVVHLTVRQSYLRIWVTFLLVVLPMKYSININYFGC